MLLREGLSGVAFRAKRSRNAYLPFESVDYLIDDQTLSSQLEIPVSKIEESNYQVGISESHISGSTEDTETDCSETDSLGSDSDVEMIALSDSSASIELQPKHWRGAEAPEEHASISSLEDFDESAFPNMLSYPYLHGHVSIKTGASKWHHKGKRNNRILGSNSRGYTNGKKSKWIHSVPKYTDRSFMSHTCRYGPTSHSPYEFSGFEGSFGWNSRSAMRGCWGDSHDHHFRGGGPMLMDVDVKVQANNYRRDVPMISLMSKLNGHAIVGHPLQIEALDRGFSTAGYFVPNPVLLTSMWRTGRRTLNSRVPRPFSPSMPNVTGKGRDVARKGSNQKVRTLSSFSSGQLHSDSRGSGGLIKNGNTCTTVVCIPINLVFSRLHEELVGRRQ